MMWYCDTCNRRFRLEDDCVQHMDHYDRWGERFPCETCDREFWTEEDAEFHMMVARHYSNYCYDCDRVFSNDNALRMHLNSSIHRDDSNFCPFCGAGFVSPSGVCHHFESGTCYKASNLNREEVHRKIQRADPNEIITNKAIEPHNEAETPNEATKPTQKGNSLECRVCQREFTNATALQQHLASAVHKPKLYHCPNKDECSKQFTSLAGVCGHLESESCGFMRYGHVRKLQKQLNRALKGEWTIRFPGLST